jgi:hypothetical protein
MNRLLPLLAVCGVFAATPDGCVAADPFRATTANAQPPVIQRLETEIQKAKKKRNELQSHLKEVRASHLQYRNWLKKQFQQAKFEDALQTARLRQAAEIQRQLSLAGIQPTGSVVVNRFGRIVGFNAGVYVNPTEHAVGRLLGRRLMNDAFDEYAAWRQAIGNDLAAARKKLSEYGRVTTQLRTDVNKLGRWIDAAERTKQKLKESGRLPEPEYASKLPPGVVLAMTFDEPTVRGSSVKVVQDLSGWGNHGVCTGCEPAKGLLGNGLKFSKDGQQLRTLLGEKEIQTVAFWVKVDSLEKPQSLLRGNGDDRSLGVRLGPSEMRIVLGGVDRKPATVAFRHGMTADKWHHLAFVIDRGQKQLSVYVDGDRKQTVTLRNGIPVPDAFLNVGGEKQGLRGVVDELVAFHRPLTAKEVKTVYQMGKDGESLAAKR